jgi:16S rRNA (uracil1498-N3)-methyltransferase
MSAARSAANVKMRYFLLETVPGEGDPRLFPEEERHALQVLRVGVGDRIGGLDGRGRSWFLEVVAAGRRQLELRAVSDPLDEPLAGTPGAPLPWIEISLPLPKGGRAEEMVDRLTQLGLSRLTPLLTSRTAPHAREVSAARLKRLRRTAREAIKQCGRLWLPEIGEPRTVPLLLSRPGRRILLDPSAEQPLSKLLESHRGETWTRESPLLLIAGPEGGFDDEERESLEHSGVETAYLAPYTLRIETAAEAALAIVGASCYSL